jgi:tetratricopeptide (TPR) repeat protein
MSDAVTLMKDADRARREGRSAEAHRDFVAAVGLCCGNGDRRELIRALKGLGQIECDLARAAAARPLYEEAVLLCRVEKDGLLLAHTIRHLGDVYRAVGHPELAEPCYHEALAIYRADAATTPLDLANAIRPLAILEEGTGRMAEAARLWTEARDLYAAVAVAEGVAECSARLAAMGA